MVSKRDKSFIVAARGPMYIYTCRMFQPHFWYFVLFVSRYR